MYPLNKEQATRPLSFAPGHTLDGYALESAHTYGNLIQHGETVTPREWADRIASTYSTDNPRILVDASAIYHAPYRRIECSRHTLTFVP